MNKLLTHSQSIKIINGKVIDNNVIDLAINPNNQNKVYASASLNGKSFNTKYDSLAKFFNKFDSNKMSLLDVIKNDSKNIATKNKATKNKATKSKATKSKAKQN